MTRRRLVIFARVPVRGRVKRRLAAGIGDAAALCFQRTTTAALLQRLAPDRRWRTRLALTPDRAAARPARFRAGTSVMPQGSGDLGRRMARALAAGPRGPVVLIGSDIPGIAAAHIARAFRQLARNDLVFGPAADGGYWLVGTRRPFLPRDLFRGVRWSTKHALADTLARVPRHWRVATVDMLEDVDDAAAYARWRTRVRVRAASRAPAGAA